MGSNSLVSDRLVWLLPTFTNIDTKSSSVCSQAANNCTQGAAGKLLTHQHGLQHWHRRRRCHVTVCHACFLKCLQGQHGHIPLPAHVLQHDVSQ